MSDCLLIFQASSEYVPLLSGMKSNKCLLLIKEIEKKLSSLKYKINFRKNDRKQQACAQIYVFIYTVAYGVRTKTDAQTFHFYVIYIYKVKP